MVRHEGNNQDLEQGTLVMRLLKLTDLADKPVYVVPAWVEAVKDPKSRSGYSKYMEGAQAELFLSGTSLAVKETPEEVVKLLEQT